MILLENNHILDKLTSGTVDNSLNLILRGKSGLQ